MFTTFDKAVAGFLGAAVFFLNYFWGVTLDLSPEMYAGVASLANAALVYFVPNKD